MCEKGVLDYSQSSYESPDFYICALSSSGYTICSHRATGTAHARNAEPLPPREDISVAIDDVSQ
ncbi:hypothetical protein [Phaffia rhodozyma]|uniref:Uncharacterized protein n=1 Tax=Phaffia rhodozyma TaxID=264483 RepID=A0A0F7SFB1_PHARH|nr:hypothetical protein [Phaffia rhodozyma]